MNNEEFKNSIKTDIPQTNSNLQSPQSDEALHSVKKALKVLDDQVKNSEGPTTFDFDAVEKLYEYLYDAKASLENTTPSIQSDKESNPNSHETQQSSEGELDISEFC